MSESNVLKEAAKVADKWVAAFNPNGKPDVKKIESILNKRTHNGLPVQCVVVASLAEVPEALERVVRLALDTEATKKQVKEKLASLDVYSSIWYYYLMAFYDAAYSPCPDQSYEFGRQSFFEAFQAGLGYYINLGNYAVGVCLPEAHMDDQNRIHSASGPAIVWGQDKQYWWHGVQVQGEWIEHKDTVDAKTMFKLTNAEQRRSFCEIVGWDRVLKGLKSTLIQQDEFGELFEVDLPNSPKSRFVRVMCGTGRVFCLPVPNTTKTALEAVALSYNVEVSDYKPETRT